MTQNKTIKLSLRLDATIYNAIGVMAREEGFETNAYIDRRLKQIATESGFMNDVDKERVQLEDRIIIAAVECAKRLYAEGKFDKHFTLTVIRDLMTDTNFLQDYERAVGGDAYENRLSGKYPLNMHLGRCIKNAIPAVPIRKPNGDPERVPVSDEPIQSYTLLKEVS